MLKKGIRFNILINMPTLTDNKKAIFDYEILETYDAGIELYGFEAKAALKGLASLKGSFVIIRGGEAFWVNAVISPYQPKNTPNWYQQDRTRKLLLRKEEINELTGKTSQKGLTLVPISIYTSRRKIKLKFGLARSKKKFEKRELIRKREVEREIHRNL